METGMSSMTPGRLFEMRLQHSAAARQRAVDSIRDTRLGVQARIGGRMRGKTITFISRKHALAAITEHYNAELFRKIREDNARALRVSAAVNEVSHENDG
jgi:hypothetical protein